VSRSGRSVGHALVRLYPAHWRDRYGSELHLIAAALREHVVGGTDMRLTPAANHPRAFAFVGLLALAPSLVVITLSGLAGGLGMTSINSAIQPLLQALDAAPRIVDLAVVLAPLAAFAIAALPLCDARLEDAGDGPALAIRVRARAENLAVVGVALLVGALLIGHIVVESVLRLGA
jgi:hypothetical protein